MLAQIVMFVVLGLLSYPSRLLQVGWHGLLIGALLIMLARPLAVGISLIALRFNWRELVFISWGGLKVLCRLPGHVSSAARCAASFIDLRLTFS